MALENFEELKELRESIPPEIKLALTIRFLASGNSYQGLSMCFRVHKSTIESSSQRFANQFVRD